jgi:hypothetical protein
MKVLVLLLLCALSVAAQDTKLSWDASTTPAVTYNVYHKASPCSSTVAFSKLNTAPVGVLTFTHINAPVGVSCYAVRSEVGGAESANSNLLQVSLPPAPPTNLRTP